MVSLRIITFILAIIAAMQIDKDGQKSVYVDEISNHWHVKYRYHGPIELIWIGMINAHENQKDNKCLHFSNCYILPVSIPGIRLQMVITSHFSYSFYVVPIVFIYKKIENLISPEGTKYFICQVSSPMTYNSGLDVLLKFGQSALARTQLMLRYQTRCWYDWFHCWYHQKAQHLNDLFWLKIHLRLGLLFWSPLDSLHLLKPTPFQPPRSSCFFHIRKALTHRLLSA